MLVHYLHCKFWFQYYLIDHEKFALVLNKELFLSRCPEQASQRWEGLPWEQMAETLLCSAKPCIVLLQRQEIS